MPEIRVLLVQMFRAKKWQEASDRAVAGKAGCNRCIVRQVRARLIAEGRHPPKNADQPRLDDDGKPIQGFIPAYKPGAVARGGYVYDETGKVVRETVWLKRQAVRKKAERAKRKAS